jgi:RHS repeat-associated protein
MGCLKLTYYPETSPLKVVKDFSFSVEKSGVGAYRYGFNGQEKETELDESTTSAEYWMYDGRLGRRWNVDPMTKKYGWQSPYATFNNNPIFFNDPSGLEGEPIVKHQVKEGESLSQLAKQYQTTVKAIKEANAKTINWENDSRRTGDKKDWIYTNEVLNIPDGRAKNSNNINSDQPKNVLYFSAGAGHDEEGTGYIESTINDMQKSGIDNPVDINSHGSNSADALWANSKWATFPYYRMPISTAAFNAPVSFGKVPLDSRVSIASEKIISYNNQNNINGEITLMGYSAGSVIMAQTALYLANEKGIRIENLILMGTTISEDSELYLALISNPNIGQVVRLDILYDNVQSPVSFLYSFSQMGNQHPHFKYAFHDNAHVNRMVLFEKILKMGIK